MATIDHVISRYNPERWVKRKPDEVRKVLACFECNTNRSNEETARLSKEELYKRGQGFSFNKGANGKSIFHKSANSFNEVVDRLKKNGIVINNNTSCTTNT